MAMEVGVNSKSDAKMQSGSDISSEFWGSDIKTSAARSSGKLAVVVVCGVGVAVLFYGYKWLRKKQK